MKKLLLLLMPVLMLALISSANATIYECDSCSDCDTKLDSASFGDIIRLNQSISIEGDRCIYTEAGVDNAVLDCQGYTISGNFTNEGIKLGEYPNFSTNITIKNCVITQFGTGIFLRSSEKNIMDNVTVYNNLYHGISFYQSGRNFDIITNLNASYNGQDGIITIQDDANIIGFVAHDNGRHGLNLDGTGDRNFYKNGKIYNNLLDGIRVYSSNSNIFQNLSVYNNTNDGFEFIHWGRSNTVNDSLIYDNGRYGFNFLKSSSYASYNNLIYNNIINNTDDFNSNSVDNINRWNTTQQTGPNTVGGQDIGGNYFVNQQSVLFDMNGDGIAYDTVTLDAQNIDYLPLTNNPLLCDSCSHCDLLLSAGSDTVINLTQDINSSGTCINMITNGRTLDCKGFKITSTGTSFPNYNVFIDADNLVLKNCEIIGGYTNVWVDTDADNFNLTNNDIHDNLGSGTACVRYKSQHNNGFVEYNEIYNCNDEAINRDGAGSVVDVTFRHNIIHDSDGIAMDDSVYYNNTLYDNIRAFDFNNGPDGAEVYDNLVYDNTYGLYITQACSNNQIYNNFFNNTNNFYVSSVSGSGNTLNIAKTSSTNIIGGAYKGGNYWSDYTGWDNTGDGLGDTEVPYVVFAGIFEDDLPLTDNIDDSSPNITIHSPQSTNYVPENTQITSVIVDVNITAEDLISGIDTCLWNYDGGSNSTYTTPTTIEVSGSGSHYVEFYCNDTAENWAYDKVDFTYQEAAFVDNLPAPFNILVAILIAAGYIIALVGFFLGTKQINAQRIVGIFIISVIAATMIGVFLIGG